MRRVVCSSVQRRIALLLLVAGALAIHPAPARAAEYAEHYARYQAALEARDLPTAVVHARRAYLAAVRERGPQAEQTGVLAYNLGIVNFELGRHRDAADALAKALGIYEAVYGAEDERVVKPLTKLAAAHGALEEWASAEREYVRAARILRDARGRDDREIALILGQLTQVADGLDEPKRMRSYGLRALAIVADDAAEEPLLVANLHLAVARAELLLGDVRQAKRHTERGVELYEKAMDEKDPRILEVYGFAAEVYAAYGKDYTARKYRRKVQEATGADD